MARILIADAEAELAWHWARILNASGHVCTAVHRGRDARALLQTGSFALLIADVLMPDGGGIMLAALRDAMFPDVKILLVTGETTEEEWTASGSHVAGAEAILFKPVSDALLTETAHHLLERQPLNG